MTKQSKNQNIETAPNVGEAVSKAELFFKENGKKLTIACAVAVAVVLVILAIIQFYVKPMKAEAASQSFVAEQYFRAGIFEEALNGHPS